MKTYLLGVLACCTLLGCASGPVPPDWQMNSRDALQNGMQAYLSGNAKVADLEFKRARSEVAKTGRLELLARVLLARCAAQAAALELNDCPEFTALASDAGAAEAAYAQFLAGKSVPQDAALLPEQYRAMLSITGDVSAGLKEIKDPVSRLIAASVLFKTKRLPPSALAIAVDTASEQGWSKALLAWLGVQLQYAKTAGDTAMLERVQRRIDLVSGSLLR